MMPGSIPAFLHPAALISVVICFGWKSQDGSTVKMCRWGQSWALLRFAQKMGYIALPLSSFVWLKHNSSSKLKQEIALECFLCQQIFDQQTKNQQLVWILKSFTAVLGLCVAGEGLL